MSTLLTTYQIRHGTELLADFLANIPQIYVYESTWDAPSIADQDYTTVTVDAEDAAIGDFALVSHSQDISPCQLYGSVSDNGTVTVTLYNPTSGTVNIASGTLRVAVIKATASGGSEAA